MSFDSSRADPSALTSFVGDVVPDASVTYHAVTGNRLRDGRSVYFVGNGRWSEHVEDAARVVTAATEKLLADAQQGHPHPVVAPYLFDVTVAEGRLRPVSLRERIRAFGPTVGPGR